MNRGKSRSRREKGEQAGQVEMFGSAGVVLVWPREMETRCSSHFDRWNLVHAKKKKKKKSVTAISRLSRFGGVLGRKRNEYFISGGIASGHWYRLAWHVLVVSQRDIVSFFVCALKGHLRFLIGL